MAETMTGGCQCGRVRYAAQVADDDAYLCHCRMCQKATGGVSIAFKNFKKADVRWTGAEPDRFESSPIAYRPFCAACGTPLGFSFLEGPNTDLTIGSFDDPSRFRPTSHFGAESIHEAWIDTSALPRQRADEYEPLSAKWIKAIGKLPD